MRLDRHLTVLIAAAAMLVGGVGTVNSAAGQSGVVARTTPARTAPTPSPVASPTPTPVPTPTPEPIPTQPVCTTGAASHGSRAAKLRGRVLRLDGVVEIRGSRTFLAVEACAGRNALPTQEFTLLKAPKTRRFIAAMSTIPKRQPDGSIAIAYVKLAVPRTERQFRRAIPRPKVTLRLPGVKGAVFARPGSPLELLATHRNGKRISQGARQKAAKAYLLTGGTV